MSTSQLVLTNKPIAGLPSQPPSTNLWKPAYELLRQRREKLFKSYRQIWREDLFDPQGATDHEIGDEISAVIEAKMEEMTDRQWNFKWGHRRLKVRDQVNRILKTVQVFAGVGQVAATLSPIHAGLPWAGICLLLPLVLNHPEQHESVINGLEEISELLGRYRAVEKLYLPAQDGGLENGIIRMYSYVLEYQATALRYLNMNTAKRIARDIPKLDDWNQQLGKIREADAKCKHLMHLSNVQSHNRQISELNIKIDKLSEALSAHVGQEAVLDLLLQQFLMDDKRKIAQQPSRLPQEPLEGFARPTDSTQVCVLYGAHQDEASVIKISLDDVEDDMDLFYSVRRAWGYRQHRLFRTYLPAGERFLTLAPFTFYVVRKIAYVQFEFTSPTTAVITNHEPSPLSSRDVAPSVRLSSFKNPSHIARSTRCLDELRTYASSNKDQWGLCIVEQFDLLKFFTSASFCCGLSVLIGMIADDFGRSTGATLRTSLIFAMCYLVIFGLLPFPAFTDRTRRWSSFYYWRGEGDAV